MNESMSLYQAVFGLEYYREYGPERIEWFLEHDVKCRGDAMRTNRELLKASYPKWLYEPELPINGRTVERARELVGSELVCESDADA